MRKSTPPPNRMRVLRAERGMTQLTLSRRTGLNPTRISFLENGLIEPTERDRERIAKAFGVSADDIFPAAVAK